MQKKIMVPMQPPEAPPTITVTETLLPPPDKRNQYVTSLALKKRKQQTSYTIPICQVRISTWILNGVSR